MCLKQIHSYNELELFPDRDFIIEFALGIKKITFLQNV